MLLDQRQVRFDAFDVGFAVGVKLYALLPDVERHSRKATLLSVPSRAGDKGPNRNPPPVVDDRSHPYTSTLTRVACRALPFRCKARTGPRADSRGSARLVCAVRVNVPTRAHAFVRRSIRRTA